jgi:NADH-quinone oxidoreductase subunit K
MAIPTTHFVILAALLFAVGAAGVLLRRSGISILLGIEIMLNAANLALLSVSRALPAGDTAGVVEGQVLAFFVLAVAAAEAAVGLAIVIALFRQKGSTDVDLARLLRW